MSKPIRSTSTSEEYDQPVLDPGDLPAAVVAAAERHVFERALRHTQGNRTRAAQLLGLSRTRFYRRLKAYGWPTQDGAQPPPGSGIQTPGDPQYTSRSSSHAR
jgi:DNA-binding NtrC family response regulator